jgi:hypothetical protein
MNYLNRVTLVAFTLALSGCLPPHQPQVVDGPISGNIAAQRQSMIRSDCGVSYSVTHTYNGHEFEAAWEIGNALKRSAQVQIKPPIDWSLEDLQAATQLVLADPQSNPWYPAINDTVLGLIREAADAKGERAVGVAPETAYELAVKVKKYSKTWFVEVKVQITYADGTSIGY